MEIDVIATPGLGDNSYLLSSGDEAAAIDPQRDAGRLLDAADARGVTIRRVLETHVHNDYVSGAAELHAATGAEVVGPAGAGYAFAFTPASDGDETAVGDVTLVSLTTPGHTFEHTAYLALERGSGAPTAVFSGGSLIVGSAGRTDLLGARHTDELTRLQFRSVRRLGELPDDVALLPTHGAGSFCANVTSGDRRTSSIAAERLGNPALTATDEVTFARRQLSGLPQYPNYYAHMAAINRAGPRVFGEVPVPSGRSADEVEALLRAGAWLVDGRDGSAFASAHVPGSLNVPLEESFASYVGWLVPFGEPLLLLVPDAAGLVEASSQLFRIGYEQVQGHLEGGIEAWATSGRDVGSYPTLGIADLVNEIERGEAGDVVDVRQRSEWEAGHLDGSRHLFVGDVPDRLDAFDPRIAATLVCRSGYRAAMAASVLDRAGVSVRLVARSGVPRALRMIQRSA